jgi:hypothetical protein
VPPRFDPKDITVNAPSPSLRFDPKDLPNNSPNPNVR